MIWAFFEPILKMVPRMSFYAFAIEMCLLPNANLSNANCNVSLFALIKRSMSLAKNIWCLTSSRDWILINGRMSSSMNLLTAPEIGTWHSDSLYLSMAMSMSVSMNYDLLRTATPEVFSLRTFNSNILFCRSSMSIENCTSDSFTT